MRKKIFLVAVLSSLASFYCGWSVHRATNHSFLKKNEYLHVGSHVSISRPTSEGSDPNMKTSYLQVRRVYGDDFSEGTSPTSIERFRPWKIDIDGIIYILSDEE